MREVVASEEWIIAHGPKLKRLAQSFQQRSLSNLSTLDLFADRVLLSDLQSPLDALSMPPLGDLDVQVVDWRVAHDTVEVGIDELAIWAAWMPFVSVVENARFFIISGHFVDPRRDEFHARVGFEALATRTDGRHTSIRAEQRLVWRRMGPDWRVAEWHQGSFRTIESSQLLFRSVLTQAIPKAEDLRRLQESRHYQILVNSYFGGEPANTPRGYTDSRFYPDSVNVHPGLSVVDIDRDGWDDLYVCVRWGRNMLLRNRGDGTFEEVAASYGLDIEGRSTSAIFADFDNDGDADLMLGRSLERSQYMINQGGRFVKASRSEVGAPLPFLVTSMSAADYNGDGLLDVYFCTYSPLDINTRLTAESKDLPPWAQKFLAEDEAAEVQRRYAHYHGFLGQVGPPNLLLVNRGNGRFEIASESSLLDGYRNSFQATWCDFDGDGDPDLYVANDFAPDFLYRNDGDRGFTDITQRAGTDLMGFGMGVGWGDYDNDGRPDLYVSNMYSKAGRRITAQVPGLDSRMIAGAEGNYLFRNLDRERFAMVSGLNAAALNVANAGWAWGGQFCDFDNDGYLDIYVSSGFYTPPEGHGKDVDL